MGIYSCAVQPWSLNLHKENHFEYSPDPSPFHPPFSKTHIDHIPIRRHKGVHYRHALSSLWSKGASVRMFENKYNRHIGFLGVDGVDSAILCHSAMFVLFIPLRLSVKIVVAVK